LIVVRGIRLIYLVSLAILAAGAALVLAAAVAGGDWYRAPEPWIDDGLNLTVIGLVAAAVSAMALLAVSPIGRTRWLAVPPLVVVAASWSFLLIGNGSAAPNAGMPSASTALYSNPSAFALTILATILIGSPLLVHARSAKAAVAG
jgi:hypothetical protein